jgi:hypothetical protein
MFSFFFFTFKLYFFTVQFLIGVNKRNLRCPNKFWSFFEAIRHFNGHTKILLLIVHGKLQGHFSAWRFVRGSTRHIVSDRVNQKCVLVYVCVCVCVCERERERERACNGIKCLRWKWWQAQKFFWNWWWCFPSFAPLFSSTIRWRMLHETCCYDGGMWSFVLIFFRKIERNWSCLDQDT